MNRWNARLALVIDSVRHLFLVLILASCLLQLAVSPAAVRAATLGITGSFPGQPFEVPLGGSVSGPSIDVWVLNESDQAMDITMSTLAPPGVTVTVEPSYNFTLPAQSRLQLFVRVDVGSMAQLGVYEGENGLAVIAEASRRTAGGVEVVGSARLNADVTVVGDSGTVTARTVSPGGDPVLAEIRLFRVIDGTRYEIGYSDVGTIEALVSPGNYVAYAYKNGQFLANSDVIAVAKDDRKDITLEVRTLYISGFGVEPQYLESGELSQARITYTVVNLEREMSSAEVRLSVTLGGVLLETVSVLTVDPLTMGRVGAPYLYAPTTGWAEGTYGFSLQLYAEGELKAETLEQPLKVGGGAGVASWLWIIFVILGILGAAGLGFLIFFLLKRRREEEKPRKAEKKRKEEKPARKAEEPVRKPEPYRPPEPVRPPPLPEEEPIVEPSPLASVSSLKARMASMGRDQGTGKPAEEEPDAGTQDEPVETGPQAGAFDVVPPPPRAEPEQPVVKKVEPKAQKPSASEKPAGQKPGIFSSVKATPKQEPPKPPGDVQINWPPKSVEPPTPVEPPKPTSFAEAARQRAEAQQIASPPEEAATEEAAPEDPTESEAPHFRSSFAEAARLRIEARRRAKETGSSGTAPEESPADGDDAGGSGEGEDRSPLP
jgi:hypothetical protein